MNKFIYVLFSLLVVAVVAAWAWFGSDDGEDLETELAG